MARVLKKASENPELWKREITCTGKGWEQGDFTPCYCLLEVTALDIRKRTSYHLGESETSYGFTCPNCGCFTEIDKNDIPNYIKNNAEVYSENEFNLLTTPLHYY